MMVHELKTWPEFFQHVISGAKTFELRRDDRGFALGDRLHLREWDHAAEAYTGRSAHRCVTYVLRDADSFGLRAGFAVLGMSAEEGADDVRS